jgi:hypothetical protein
MVEILPRLRVAGLRPLTPNGILGDPRPAQAARGKRYLLAEVHGYQEMIPTNPL